MKLVTGLMEVADLSRDGTDNLELQVTLVQELFAIGGISKNLHNWGGRETKLPKSLWP